VVIYLSMTSVQISYWIWTCNNSEDQSALGETTDKTAVAPFSEHSYHLSYLTSS